MNKVTFRATVIATLCVIGAPSFAQTLGNSNELGQSAASTALNAGNNQSSTYYSAAPSPVTAGRVDNNWHTNQSMSAAPAFGVQGSGCTKPGSGGTVQVVGAGAALAIAGDPDEGCEAPRDINTMKMSGGFSDEDYQARACMVPKIAKTKACVRLAKKMAEEQRVNAVLNDEPSIPVATRQPAPGWKAGG